MPPVRRPDDKSGRAFRKVLQMVERCAPARSFEPTDPEWQPERLSYDGGDAGEEHRAAAGDYTLLVVEMNEEFLATEPPMMPRVSWSISTGKDREETLVGGIAPSVAIAKARAETVWRALLGYKRA